MLKTEEETAPDLEKTKKEEDIWESSWKKEVAET